MSKKKSSSSSTSKAIRGEQLAEMLRELADLLQASNDAKSLRLIADVFSLAPNQDTSEIVSKLRELGVVSESN